MFTLVLDDTGKKQTRKLISESFTTITGTTEFTLSNTFSSSTRIRVEVNGVANYATTDWTRNTGTNKITFTYTIPTDSSVSFTLN
jgi:hypothetical protein